MAESLVKRLFLTLLQELWVTRHLEQVCSQLPGITSRLSEFDQWIAKGLVIMEYEGLNGMVWPTYVDLEFVWVMEQLLCREANNEEVLELVLERAEDLNLNTTTLGLAERINEIEPGLVQELPIRRRLHLLRFILKGCEDRPNRLRGIANPVVCIPASCQSEEEAQFASLEKRIKDEWFLASLFHPMKYKDEASATLHSVEEAIRSLEQKESK